MISLTVTLVVLFTAISGSFKIAVTEKNDTKQNQQHFIHLKDQGEDENPNSSSFESQWVKNYGGREDFNVRNSLHAGYFDINRVTNRPSYEFPKLTVKPSVIVQPRIFEEIFQICSENVARGDSQNYDVIIKCKSEIAPTKFADHMQDLKKIVKFEGYDLECLVSLLREKYGNSRSMKDGSQWLMNLIRRNSKSNVKSIDSAHGHAWKYLLGEVHHIMCFLKAVSLFPSNLEHPTDGSHYKSIKLATANHQIGLPTEDANQNLKRRFMQKAYSTLSSKATPDAGQGFAASVLQGAKERGWWLWEKSAPMRDTVSTEGRKYFEKAATGGKNYWNAASRRFRGSGRVKIQDNLSLDGRSFAESAPGVINHILSANERKNMSQKESSSGPVSEEQVIQALKKDNLFNCLLDAVKFIPSHTLGLVTENITGTATKGWNVVRGLRGTFWGGGVKSPGRSPARNQTSSRSRNPNGISSPSRSRSPTRNPSNPQSPSFTDVVTGAAIKKTYEMVKECFQFFEHDKEGNLILNQEYAAGTAESVLMNFPTTALMLGTARAITKNVRMKRDKDGKLNDYDVDTRGLVIDLGMAAANATPIAGLSTERGYFGPWTVCKQQLYGRARCGEGISRFHPVVAVKVAGLFAVGGVVILAIFCILSILQIAMVVSKEQVVMPYSSAVTTKLALALVAALLAIIAAGLFALQTDDHENDFEVTRGESFYMQIVLLILNFLLFIVALYDVMFARRMGGDPTMCNRDPTGAAATTFNNPGFREKSSMHPGGGISMTHASGKPYLSSTNGSVASMSTTLSSNGSTTGSVSRIGPLRSSLKKPRTQTDGLGIQNPGFSGTSPTLSRNGSVKKVRIQTHSTAV